VSFCPAQGSAPERTCRSRVGPEDLSGQIKLHSSLDSDAPDNSKQKDGTGKLLGTVVTVLGLCLLIAGGVIFQDQIRAFLMHFTEVVDDMGLMGVLLYALVYAGLEVLAVPAIPLTMASGAIFGIVPGSLLVSFAGTLAATTSFLIARYIAKERVCSPPHFAQCDYMHPASLPSSMLLTQAFSLLPTFRTPGCVGRSFPCSIVFFRILLP
jgi:hypothetical protein